MFVKTKISPSTLEDITFKTESGCISSRLGNLVILDGFSNLEDCILATKKWFNANIGLQIEYHTNTPSS